MDDVKFKFNIGDVVQAIESINITRYGITKEYQNNLRVQSLFLNGSNRGYIVVAEDGELCYFDEEKLELQEPVAVPTEAAPIVDGNKNNSRLLDEDTYQSLMRLGLLDTSVRSYNRGASDYSRHVIQPWSVWMDYSLNPWDADIVKRVLRKKEGDSRRLDYEKIIHICEERIRQIDYGQE